MAIKEKEEEEHLPGCRSAMQRPCTERHRKALAWGCTGDMEKTRRLPQGRWQLIPEDGDQCWGLWGWGGIQLFPPRSPNICREGMGMRKQGCFTFRIGARKTEIPVNTKTMMPVTLCSLERQEKRDEAVLAEPAAASGLFPRSEEEHGQVFLT